MVTLANTADITLDRQWSLDEGTFYEVRSFGDGNCALNAFALGLIDIIKRGELSLEKEKQEYFLYYLRVSLRILEERLALYRGESSELNGDKYEDVADSLAKFIQFIYTDPSYFVFLEYVKRQTSREEIAALHVGLAPALRHIGVDEHIGAIKTVMSDKEVLNAKMFDEANELYYDGQWAGHDVLSHLAVDFFKVNLLIYSEKLQRRVDLLDNPIIDAPCICVLYKGAHYNCLLPQSTLENQDSLATTLTTTMNKKDQLIVKGLLQVAELTTKKIIHPRDITNMAALATEVSERLLMSNVFSGTVTAELLNEARELAGVSEKLRMAVMEKLEIKDVNLERAGVKLDMEKELLRCAEVDTKLLSADEALARILQNVEILRFMESHHQHFLSWRDKLLTQPSRSLAFPGLLFPARGAQVLGALGGVLSMHPDILKQRPDDTKEPPLAWAPILK